MFGSRAMLVPRHDPFETALFQPAIAIDPDRRVVLCHRCRFDSTFAR